MVVFSKINMDLFLFITLLLCIPLIETENTNCNGKSFHCANSTHFMICVDVGGGVSMTFNNFLLPCPPTTFCLETNSFECEYRTPTTQKSIFQKSEVPNELIETNTTTVAYGDTVPEIAFSKTENTFVLPLQKYYSIATTNKILADNMMNTIPSTRLRLVLKNETVNKNDNEDNMNNKLKPEIAINLNNTYKSKSQSIFPKLESEQVVNVFVDVDAKAKRTNESFTTEIFPSENDGKFSNAVTTLISDGYNSEHFTQSNITVDLTQNSTTNSLVNAPENNLYDSLKNNNSIRAAMVNETTEIINTFFNNTMNDNVSDTKFISDIYFTNGSLKEPNTMAFPSNISFNDMEFSNTATNDEVNGQLNMVSGKVDMFKTTENYYGTTENIQSLPQINSYITTVRIKQSENVTNELYHDQILIATPEETLTATNAKSFQAKSKNPYPDHIKINSTPTTEICSQNGNVTCFVNDDSLNTINESRKVITVDTTLSSLEGTRDITKASLLNKYKDYFMLYDESFSTILMNSTDSTNSLQTFTNSYTENKLYDIIPTTLPNYSINITTLKSFNQQSNKPSKIESIEVDTESKLINNSLTTETIPVVQVFSGFESAPTTFKSRDNFNAENVKQNISNINIVKNTSMNYLKLGTSKKVSQDKTQYFETVTEVLDKTVKEINTKISNKLPNNKEYGFTDKMSISDNCTLNDSLIEPNMTTISNNISSFKQYNTNSTKTSEEYNTQLHKDSENIEDIPKKGFRLLEQTNNDEITLKSVKLEKFTTMYPDKIFVTTAPDTITTTYLKKRFQDEVVTNYPKLEYITTTSTLVSKLSIQNNNVVFTKDNNSLRYVNKNITTYYTLPKTTASIKDITTSNILNTDKDIFTLNGKSRGTVVNLTNSSYKLDSHEKFKNYDSLREMDSVSQNYTINSTTKKVPNENFTSNNNLLNLNVDMKANNLTLYNVISNGSSSNEVENKVVFTDISELKANNLFNHAILDPTNKFYDTAIGNYTKANLDINLQRVTRRPINITTPNSDKKFRDLQNATFMSIVNNNEFSNKFVENSKSIFLANIFSDYNQTYLNNTTVMNEYELVDNVIAHNSVTNKPKENLTINEFENQNVPINNVIQPSVHLTHEKIINDFREYKPINQQMNSEIVTETTNNALEQYTHSTLDMYKYFRTNYDTGDVITLNIKESNTRSLFDTSTLTIEDKHDNILTKIKGERGNEILKNYVFTHNQSTTDAGIRISHNTSGSLSEEKNILKEKNNTLKTNNTDSANQKMGPFKMKQLINIDNLSINITSHRRRDEIVNASFNTIETTLETPSFEKSDKLINTYDSNQNTTNLDKNFINSTTDLFMSEIRSKLRSTNIFQNDTDKILESNLSNKTAPYIHPSNVYNETQTAPLHAMVTETHRNHLLSVNTTIDKTYFSTDATNDKNVHENETIVVNIGQEENTTNKKIDENYQILNSTITNFTEISSIINSNNNKSNQYILSQIKELEHTATTLIPTALYKISNNNTEIIREYVSKQLDNDSLNNTSLSGLHQSKIPVKNITDLRSSIQKEHDFLKSTTIFHDFLLVTPESKQLKELTTSAGTDTEIMQNREKRLKVGTNYPQNGDTENYRPLINVLNNKEIIQNFSNNYSRTESLISVNKVEDFLSNKTIKNSTKGSSINNDIEINIRTGSKSDEPSITINDIKQVININVNVSWNQAGYDNNNKSSNFSEAGTINNVSLKLPSTHIEIRHGKNIANINLIKDLFLLQTPLSKPLNLSYNAGRSTEMPNSLNLSARLENNETREQPDVGREIRLQGSGKINITTYSGSSIHKNELMKNKNTTKFVTTNFNYNNTTTNSQITYYNNRNAYKAVDANISDTRKSSFHCKNNFRGKFGDKDNCRKFYICISNSIAVVGLCSINTVFSDYSKQCTNNLSHCVRNYQFQCTSEGRFGDVIHENIYYVCIKGLNHNFIRFKFKCQNGYTLDKKDMICKITEKMLNSSSSSSDTLKNKKLENDNVSNKKQNFKCEREGKFVDPFNGRRYYICSKTSKSILRRRRKNCDSDEVFDNDKNKCVDKDSHEYS